MENILIKLFDTDTEEISIHEAVIPDGKTYKDFEKAYYDARTKWYGGRAKNSYDSLMDYIQDCLEKEGFGLYQVYSVAELDF